MADRQPLRAGIRTAPSTTSGQALTAVTIPPQVPLAPLDSTVSVNVPQDRTIDIGRAYPSAPELSPFEIGEVADVGVVGQAGLGALSTLTFDQEEMLSMLKEADPNIVAERGPDGEIYVNRPGGNRYVLNRPGLSGNDAIQIMASILGTTPQTLLTKTPIKRVLGDIAFESGLQTSQAVAGGEFNALDPLMAGGASAASEVIPVTRSSGARREGARRAEQTAGPVGRQVVETSVLPENMAQREFQRIVDPDPVVVQAAQELGLEDVLPPKVYSRNQRYIEFEQAMRRANESDLANIDRTALEQVNNRADQFLTLFGGERDIAGLSEAIRSDITSTIAASHTITNELYDQLAEKVPVRSLVETNEIRRYLLNRARDLGGISKLNKTESDLLKEISKAGRGSRRMTYGRIDDIRQTIGSDLAAAYRGQPLGSGATHQLSSLYEMLTNAQGNAISEIAGQETKNLWDVAKSTVAQRKALEERATILLGKDLANDAMPKLVGQMGSQLPKGKTDEFLKTLNAIPEGYRQDAVITALGQMFELGARKPGLNMGGYASWWEKVSRQKGVLNALNLDADAVIFLDNLAKVSRAYNKATTSVPATGVVRAIQNVAGKDGFMNKLLGVPMVGKPLKLIVGDTANPDLVSSTNALLENAAFGRFVSDAVSGKPTNELEARLIKSPVVQAWIAEVPPATAARITSVGLTRYFFGGKSEDKK
jgi:hypothetical protein